MVPVPITGVPDDGVNVHEPVAGNPLKATLPVGVPHVGWVIIPITGADWELTVMVNVWIAEASIPPLDVPPSSFILTETVAEPL